MPAYLPCPGLRATRFGLEAVRAPADLWPRVDIVLNHAGADGRLVHACVAAGARRNRGRRTGHGSIGARLEAALVRARNAGVRVRRASRCAFGPVLGQGDDDAPNAVGELNAVQARVALQLQLLVESAA